MQSTGVYWMPVFEVLEQQGLEVCLVNAQHTKNVPGRKSDVHHHPAAGVSMLAEATRFWPAE
jgi:transposase